MAGTHKTGNPGSRRQTTRTSHCCPPRQRHTAACSRRGAPSPPRAGSASARHPPRSSDPPHTAGSATVPCSPEAPPALGNTHHTPRTIQSPATPPSDPRTWEPPPATRKSSQARGPKREATSRTDRHGRQKHSYHALRGTWTCWPHFGQFSSLPRYEPCTRRCLPQSGHSKLTFSFGSACDRCRRSHTLSAIS